MVLNMADNLSASLQGSSVSTNEGQNLMSMTVTTLESIRSEDSFRLNNVDSNLEWQSQTYQDSAKCPGDMKLVHQYLKCRHQWRNSTGEFTMR